MLEELKTKILQIKAANPDFKAKAIWDIVSEEYEVTRKQVSNILTHNKVPPIPMRGDNEEEETMSVPMSLFTILHDEFLSAEQKIEVLKIMFPDDE